MSKLSVRFSRVLLVPVVMGGLLGGCATDLSGSHYARSEVRQGALVNYGTVTALRPIKIDGTQGYVGTATGAALGGLAGSLIGHNKGSIAGAIAGAVGGGFLGNQAEKKLTSADGVEITVRLDNGTTVAVVQQANIDQYLQMQVGQRVRVMQEGSTYRVAP